MFPITDDEWDAALANTTNSDDPKLPHTLTRQGLVRPGYDEEHALYQTKSSFLKFPNVSKLFTMRKGDNKEELGFLSIFQRGERPIITKNDAIIGKGSYGQVRRMMDRDGNPSAVKIQWQFKEETEQKMIKKRIRESHVLEDLNESVGTVSRVNKKNNTKFYTHIYDHGRCLLNVLKEEKSSLNNDRRMRLAIGACLAVVEKHHLAHYSKTKTRYAHGDLKDENFTVDSEDRVFIVDFGTCKKNPQSGLRKSWGTELHRPPLDVQLKKWQYDVLALSRTIIVPLVSVNAKGYRRILVSKQFSQDRSILTPELIEQYKLYPLFDTSVSNKETRESFEQDDTTSLLACAYLISQYYHMDIPVQTLKNNSFICLIIVDLYMHGCLAAQMKDIVTAIMQKEVAGTYTLEETINKALQISRIINLHVNSEEIQQSGDLAKLIIKLERLGLVYHVHKIRRSPRLNELLSSDFEDKEFFEQLNLLLEELPADSIHCNQIIDMFFDQRELVNIMVNNQLIRSFHDTILSEPQIQLIHQCNKLGLTPFEFHRSVQNILKNPELMRIVSVIFEKGYMSSKKWTLKIGFLGKYQKEKADLYAKAANILIDRNSNEERYNAVIDILITIDIDNSESTMSLLKVVVHLLEKNILLPSFIQMAKDNNWYREFIISLMEQGLGDKLESILKHPRMVLSTLSTILKKEPLEFFDQVINDRALIEKIGRLCMVSVQDVKVYQFLLKEQFEFNQLNSTQINSLVALIPSFNSEDQEQRNKITELIKPQKISLSGLLPSDLFRRSAEASSSTTLSQPGPSM